jgi:hypothetical protein
MFSESVAASEGSGYLISSATGDLIVCDEPSAFSELVVSPGDLVSLCLLLCVLSFVF